MRKAGRIVRDALLLAGTLIKPGALPRDIDRAIHDYIVSCGAQPSFLGFDGFPASSCISPNDAVVHGIPGDVPLKEGDIVGIDVGAVKDGYHGDSARCFPVGKISAEAQRLIDTTQRALDAGIAAAKAGNRLGDIGHSVQSVAEGEGFSVVRDLVGHGIGTSMHEPPDVPNFGKAGHGLRLVPGMTIAIEPMINQGGWRVCVLDDDWTIVTEDGSLSAQIEDTVLITEDGTEILTR